MNKVTSIAKEALRVGLYFLVFSATLEFFGYSQLLTNPIASIKQMFSRS